MCVAADATWRFDSRWSPQRASVSAEILFRTGGGRHGELYGMGRQGECEVQDLIISARIPLKPTVEMINPASATFLLTEVPLSSGEAPGGVFERRAVIAEPVDQVLSLFGRYPGAHSHRQTSELAVSLRRGFFALPDNTVAPTALGSVAAWPCKESSPSISASA